jgi:HEAT repeat protein
MSFPLIVAFAVGIADAAEPSSLRQQVITLLSGIEDPATGVDWAALGAPAGDELLAIAKDEAALPTQRGNALVALGYFPSEAARSHLVGLVASDSADSQLRRKACYGLATGWGADSVATLSVALGSADVQVRTAAARALGMIGSDAARSALASRLDIETNNSVRDAITRAQAGQE